MSILNEYEFRNDFTRVRRLEVGKTYLVKTAMAASPMNENGSIYPWGDKRTKIPVKVEEEHSTFYTVTVLPHHSHFPNFGISRPYRVSIDKWDLESDSGGFKAYEYDYYTEYDAG